MASTYARNACTYSTTTAHDRALVFLGGLLVFPLGIPSNTVSLMVSCLGVAIHCRYFFCNCFNPVWWLSGNSGGRVRLGMFFYVEWWWNYAEMRSGGRFMVDLGFGKYFLCIIHDFESRYFISLR